MTVTNVECCAREEILRAAAALGISLQELDGCESKELRDDLLKRFGRTAEQELTTANLRDYSAVQHPDSWRWVDEFLVDAPAYLLYDCPGPHCSAFLVPSGKQVVAILAECFGFVFYVTNREREFLLAQNDHDYIIGAGSAREWVETLRPRHAEWRATISR